MKKTLIILALLALNCLTAQAANLEIPDSFEFLAVDGKDVGGWISKPTDLDLTPGLHKIALKYYDAVEDEDNPRMQDFISSEPILLTLEVVGHHQYRLVPHPQINSDPRAYSDNPRVKIVRSDGEKVQFDVALMVKKGKGVWEKMTSRSGSSEQAKPKSDMEKLTSADAPVAVSAAPATRSIAPTASSRSVAAPSAESTAGNMLNYWWQQADQATRAAFLKQILN